VSYYDYMMKVSCCIVASSLCLFAMSAYGQIGATISSSVVGSGTGANASGPIADSTFGYDASQNSDCLDAAYADSLTTAGPSSPGQNTYVTTVGWGVNLTSSTAPSMVTISAIVWDTGYGHYGLCGSGSGNPTSGSETMIAQSTSFDSKCNDSMSTTINQTTSPQNGHVESDKDDNSEALSNVPVTWTGSPGSYSASVSIGSTDLTAKSTYVQPTYGRTIMDATNTIMEEDLWIMDFT